MSDTENPESKPAQKTHIEVVNAQGQRTSVPRDEYQSNVLPQLVKASYDDPERLTAVIMQAVRDGFADDVIAAANRLTVIDKDNAERSLTVLSVVQRDSGDLDLAEGTLNELLQRKPGAPAAYVGLAMLQERQDNLEKCEQLLWQALELDCNHPDAVHGYLQTRHRKVGDDGYEAEIRKVMALPSAWRAHMWLARLLLTREDDAGAVAIYSDILSKEPVESAAARRKIALTAACAAGSGLKFKIH